MLKEKRNATVILGGYHASCMPDDIDMTAFDSIVVGEGDDIIRKVVHDFENNGLNQRYDGILGDVNSFPYPARNLIEDQGSNIFAYNKHYSEGGSTVVVSARGCPFRCSFCATQVVWKNKVRFRSVDNVIGEIEEIVNKYRIRQIRFSDETFTLNRKRTIELCEEMQKYNIYWKCSTRSDKLDEELLIKMKDSGCKEIALGIESADPNVLKLLNKDISVEDNKRALKLCAKVGINTRILFMTGTPGETVETPEFNINFMKSVPFHMASVSVFKPLPGCPIWDNPEKYGVKILNKEFSLYNITMWQKGSSEENTAADIIEIEGLSRKQIEINRKKMLDFIMGLNKMNMG
jgi:radical SAM superfamily enzyme YgiQ (UPF0313 family)